MELKSRYLFKINFINISFSRLVLFCVVLLSISQFIKNMLRFIFVSDNSVLNLHEWTLKL